MSNSLAAGGDSGSSCTATVHGGQSFGWVMLMPGSFNANANSAPLCTSVSDSQGGVWEAGDSRIGSYSITDRNPNSLTIGPSFLRTSGNPLNTGDTVTAHWASAADHNIFMVAQIGGAETSIVYPGFDPYTADARSSYLPAPDSGIAVTLVTWRSDTAQNTYQTLPLPVPIRDAECVMFSVAQPGRYGFRSDLSLISEYVSNYNSNTSQGDLEIVVCQGYTGAFTAVDPGGSFTNTLTQIIVASAQFYDRSLFFTQAKGALGDLGPTAFTVSSKFRR